MDPCPALWRGVREFPSWSHVDAVLGRLGAGVFAVAPGARPELLELEPDEKTALACLRARPMTLAELLASFSLASPFSFESSTAFRNASVASRR